MKIIRSSFKCKECGAIFAFRAPWGFLSEKSREAYWVWRWDVDLHIADCVNGRVEAFFNKEKHHA